MLALFWYNLFILIKGRCFKDMKKKLLNTDKIINSQRSLGRIPYGFFGNAEKNACGIISVHNLKVILGLKTDFGEDYKKASKWGTNLAIGSLGTNPFYVNRLLKKLKVDKKSYRFAKVDNLHEIFNKHDLVIIAYSWGNIMKLHYAIFEKKTDRSITGYNSNQSKSYIDVDELINDEPIKKVIVAWGIDKKA